MLRQLIATSLVYGAVNFTGTYTKYLTDRSQRKAFLETHRSTETRFKTQKENEQQEKLLLSGKYFSFFNNLYCILNLYRQLWGPNKFIISEQFSFSLQFQV